MSRGARSPGRWVLPAWTGPESPQSPVHVEDSRCSVRYNGGSKRCARPAGHAGMHRTELGDLRWGGRYKPAELSGVSAVLRDARRDQSARLRRPRGDRCSVCLRGGQDLAGGVCADRQSCEAAAPTLFAGGEQS